MALHNFKLGFLVSINHEKFNGEEIMSRPAHLELLFPLSILSSKSEFPKMFSLG